MRNPAIDVDLCELFAQNMSFGFADYLESICQRVLFFIMLLYLGHVPSTPPRSAPPRPVASRAPQRPPCLSPR